MLHIGGNELLNCGLVFVGWTFQRLAFIDSVCVSWTNVQVRLWASPPWKKPSYILVLSPFCVVCNGSVYLRFADMFNMFVFIYISSMLFNHIGACRCESVTTQRRYLILWV